MAEPPSHTTGEHHAPPAEAEGYAAAHTIAEAHEGSLLGSEYSVLEKPTRLSTTLTSTSEAGDDAPASEAPSSDFEQVVYPTSLHGKKAVVAHPEPVHETAESGEVLVKEPVGHEVPQVEDVKEPEVETLEEEQGKSAGKEAIPEPEREAEPAEEPVVEATNANVEGHGPETDGLDGTKDVTHDKEEPEAAPETLAQHHSEETSTSTPHHEEKGEDASEEGEAGAPSHHDEPAGHHDEPASHHQELAGQPDESKVAEEPGPTEQPEAPAEPTLVEHETVEKPKATEEEVAADEPKPTAEEPTVEEEASKDQPTPTSEQSKPAEEHHVHEPEPKETELPEGETAAPPGPKDVHEEAQPAHQPDALAPEEREKPAVQEEHEAAEETIEEPKAVEPAEGPTPIEKHKAAEAEPEAEKEEPPAVEEHPQPGEEEPKAVEGEPKVAVEEPKAVEEVSKAVEEQSNPVVEEPTAVGKEHEPKEEEQPNQMAHEEVKPGEEQSHHAEQQRTASEEADEHEVKEAPLFPEAAERAGHVHEHAEVPSAEEVVAPDVPESTPQAADQSALAAPAAPGIDEHLLQPAHEEQPEEATEKVDEAPLFPEAAERAGQVHDDAEVPPAEEVVALTVLEPAEEPQESVPSDVPVHNIEEHHEHPSETKEEPEQHAAEEKEPPVEESAPSMSGLQEVIAASEGTVPTEPSTHTLVEVPIESHKGGQEPEVSAQASETLPAPVIDEQHHHDEVAEPSTHTALPPTEAEKPGVEGELSQPSLPEAETVTPVEDVDSRKDSHHDEPEPISAEQHADEETLADETKDQHLSVEKEGSEAKEEEEKPAHALEADVREPQEQLSTAPGETKEAVEETTGEPAEDVTQTQENDEEKAVVPAEHPHDDPAESAPSAESEKPAEEHAQDLSPEPISLRDAILKGSDVATEEPSTHAPTASWDVEPDHHEGEQPELAAAASTTLPGPAVSDDVQPHDMEVSTHAPLKDHDFAVEEPQEKLYQGPTPEELASEEPGRPQFVLAVGEAAPEILEGLPGPEVSGQVDTPEPAAPIQQEEPETALQASAGEPDAEEPEPGAAVVPADMLVEVHEETPTPEPLPIPTEEPLTAILASGGEPIAEDEAPDAYKYEPHPASDVAAAASLPVSVEASTEAEPVIEDLPQESSVALAEHAQAELPEAQKAYSADSQHSNSGELPSVAAPVKRSPAEDGESLLSQASIVIPSPDALDAVANPQSSEGVVEAEEYAANDVENIVTTAIAKDGTHEEDSTPATLADALLAAAPMDPHPHDAEMITEPIMVAEEHLGSAHVGQPEARTGPVPSDPEEVEESQPPAILTEPVTTHEEHAPLSLPPAVTSEEEDQSVPSMADLPKELTEPISTIEEHAELVPPMLEVHDSIPNESLSKASVSEEAASFAASEGLPHVELDETPLELAPPADQGLTEPVTAAEEHVSVLPEDLEAADSVHKGAHVHEELALTEPITAAESDADILETPSLEEPPELRRPGILAEPAQQDVEKPHLPQDAEVITEPITIAEEHGHQIFLDGEPKTETGLTEAPSAIDADAEVASGTALVAGSREEAQELPSKSTESSSLPHEHVARDLAPGEPSEATVEPSEGHGTEPAEEPVVDAPANARFEQSSDHLAAPLDIEGQSATSSDTAMSLPPSSPRSDLSSTADAPIPTRLNAEDLQRFDPTRPAHRQTPSVSEASIRTEPPSSPAPEDWIASERSFARPPLGTSDSAATIFDTDRAGLDASTVSLRDFPTQASDGELGSTVPAIVATTPTPTTEASLYPLQSVATPKPSVSELSEASIAASAPEESAPLEASQPQPLSEELVEKLPDAPSALNIPGHLTGHSQTQEDDQVSESAETSVSDASHVPVAPGTPVGSITPVATPTVEDRRIVFPPVGPSPLRQNTASERALDEDPLTDELDVTETAISPPVEEGPVNEIPSLLPEAAGILAPAANAPPIAMEEPEAPLSEGVVAGTAELLPTVPPVSSEASGSITPAAAHEAQVQVEEAQAESVANEWYLKEIQWSMTGHPSDKKPIRIITQEVNGSCSLIALCNALILKGDIEILPPTRKSVSYDYLSSLVATFLLTNRESSNLGAALSALPSTRSGLDVDPLFTSIDGFKVRASSKQDDGTGELALFRLAGVPLLHGWVVDPSAAEYDVMSKIGDYDSAVELIAAGDELTGGQLLGDYADVSLEALNNPAWTAEQRSTVEKAITVNKFLKASSQQLTYHGLFGITSAMRPHELAVLFRNSHLSVIYKRPGLDGAEDALYTLVTDSAFLNEPAVVWETMRDIEGALDFVDSDFHPSSTLGGDWAGQAHVHDDRSEHEDGFYDRDLAYAEQIQAEENAKANQLPSEPPAAHTRDPASLSVPPRVRQISTTSTMTQHPPGAWLTKSPSMPQHMESHENANPEFSPREESSEFRLRKHETRTGGEYSEGKKKEDKNGGRCVIM